MSNKLNIIEFDEIVNEQGFEKTSKRLNKALKYGQKELLRNKRKQAAKRKGRM